jgi:lipopolysaccharide export system permease protein
MIGVIDRYVLKEVFKVFLGVFGTVVLIVVSMLLLRTLEQVNAGALGSDVLLRFIGLQVARDTSSLLPPVFFIAALAALGRMARDSELIALGACGFGPVRTYRSLFLGAVPVALATAFLTLYLQPLVAREIQELRTQQRDQVHRLASLQAGRFYQQEGGEVTVYVDEILDRERLRNIFIHDARDGETKVIFSREGLLRRDESSGEQYVTLLDGRRYDGTPGQADYAIGEFARYNLRIEPRETRELYTWKRSTYPTRDLLGSNELGDRAELQQRLAGPLAVLVLTLLSVPLTTKSPRQRGTWRMFLAFLTYVTFFNLQRLASSWFEMGVTPAWLGSLWYQALVLAVVLALLLPDGRWLRRLRGPAQPSGAA